MEGFNLAGPLSFCDLEKAQLRKVGLSCWFLTYIYSARTQKRLHLLNRLTLFSVSSCPPEDGFHFLKPYRLI